MSGGGIGECVGTLPPSWFATAASASATVSVRYSGTQVASAAGTVTLVQQPTHTSLSSAGMVATMAQAPLFAGDSFTVDVAANTGPAAYALNTWQLEAFFDTH